MNAFVFLEEYCIANPEGRMTKYAGNRVLSEVPGGRKTGATYGETVELKEPVTIFRGGASRVAVSLPEGCRVWRWITPLEGRR